MKKLCCALLSLLPLTAFAYPIEVEKSMNGAEVSYDVQEVAPNIGAIFLVNQGQSAARCTAIFRNGPEAPRSRRVLLQSGDKANLSVRFTRDILRLRIRLECGLE